ncbi:ABC transporter ATP-binding protein [Pseudochelatococcus sp. B33]
MSLIDNGLVISDLSVRYGRKTIVRDLALPALLPGTLTVLIGPNAAGKSTLLRGLAGFNPIKGTITLDGTEVGQLSRTERTKRISYLPQTLPPGIALTALEAVISARVGGSARDQETFDQALAALEQIRCDHLALQPLAELSGGQRQLVGIAQAIVRAPRVLLLDEPTSALDLRHQILVMECVASLTRKRDMITIAVLHDINLAARYADTIAVLANGRLNRFGKPAEAIDPEMLARVYGVLGRVNHETDYGTQVLIDGAIA